MELATIEMDRTEARKAFLDYRRAVRERHTEEDEAIMRGYRELAKGVSLIRLSEVLAAAGTIELQGRAGRLSRLVQLPALAVARADVAKVWTEGVTGAGGCSLRYVLSRWEADRAPRSKRHRIPDGTFAARDGGDTWGSPTFVAMAPNVPPALRPAHHLRNYHLLWEAEWAQEPIPPGDPALLKHLGGDLYAVLATWDLTPLEQAVLAGTRA